MLSFTEENYLKALVQLTLFDGQNEIGVNKLASSLQLKPATVSDMIKKLKEKGYVHFEKYGKISLSEPGRVEGLLVIRRHRLWETFLHDKLEFSWDEVHELAEELEHIHSKKLINRLDSFLDFPQVDPHGDPIPTEKGEIVIPFYQSLSDVVIGSIVKVMVVKDNSSDFLKYLDKLGVRINSVLRIDGREEFDGMMTIAVNGERKNVSKKVTDSILVEKT